MASGAGTRAGRSLATAIAAEVGPCTIWKYDSSGFTSLETLSSRLVAEVKERRPRAPRGIQHGRAHRPRSDAPGPSINLRKVVLINRHTRARSSHGSFLADMHRNAAWQPVFETPQRGRVEPSDDGDLVPCGFNGFSRKVGALAQGHSCGEVRRTGARLAHYVAREFTARWSSSSQASRTCRVSNKKPGGFRRTRL